MTDVALKVNGTKYEGWTSARITRGIESLMGGFELSVSDRWRGDSAPWAILPEDECTVGLGGRVVITGYVDSRRVSYDATTHSLSISGRDKASALAENSAVLKVWEFHNTPVLTIAQRVAEPFGIKVTLDATGHIPTPAKVAISTGESPADVIIRVCRLAGLLPCSDGRGGLVLMRPGSARATTELVEGQNILSASGAFDASNRFRRYVVLGQGNGSDDLFGAAVATVTASAQDMGVRRADRVLVVRPEGNVSIAQAQRRAAWEATVRAAQGDSVTVTVQGWAQADGSLWPLNALVKVTAPKLGINGDLLISRAVFSVGSEGTTTELTLRRPDAFKPEPTVKPEGGWREIARGV